jgi:hypothetical protein
MAQGGARLRAGRTPDPNSLRSEKRGADWTDLPASGREGPTPEWPLGSATDAEVAMWARLWRKPQALLWERDGVQDQVAVYVRTFCEGALPDAPVNRRTLVRQQEAELLLNIPSMLSALVRIVAEPQVQTASPSARPSTRDRLRAVPSAESS